MFRLRIFAAFIAALFTASFVYADKYVYDTVPGDPMNVKMYTLPNGLRLYMSVNRDRPKIQTNIAVRVGAKNDPAETTGLAHYFEHMMFKGTQLFGTSDYEAERPLLDRIEELFETYRATADSAARAAIYHRIDSISYLAAAYAIPNEYDKLMSVIGSEGTNAYTSYDETCYVELIPSNQLDNWARIQSIRFSQPVLRGFHTELETIYEEKNMSLNDDGDRVFAKLQSILFPNHPYGRQTILGSQEHLKNPSITNVKNYFKQWYVPNNIAIVLSGDFDPDEAVDIISRYFGALEPRADLEMMPVQPEMPIPAPVEAEVTSPEAEMVYIAWRLPASKHPDSDAIQMLDLVLSNGRTGLIDIDINHAQTMLQAGCFPYMMADHSLYIVYGSPLEGQSLEEARDLLLDEIRKLRDGEWDEAVMPSIINNYKLHEMRALESNDSRVDAMVASFINGAEWADEVASLARQEAMSKEDILRVARQYLGDNNYVIVYKRQGPDESIAKVDKPAITPLPANRDTASPFLVELQDSPVEPIEPRFADYSADLTFLTAQNDIPVIYKRNDTNDIFTLHYIYETGSNANLDLGTAPGYFSLLGTADMTPEEIKQAFYAMACDFRINIGDRRSSISLSGLSENMPQAMALMERVIAGRQPDADVWAAYAERIIKAREDSKSDFSTVLGALSGYAIYGQDAVNHRYTYDQLRQLDPTRLTDAVKSLRELPHRVVYYGPMSEQELLTNLAELHYTPTEPAPLPEQRVFAPQLTPETVFYIAPYDANNIKMYLISNLGENYDPKQEPLRWMYNQYFDGDMGSIVFQEMRESRSLAYSASAWMRGSSWLDVPYIYYAYIETQNDKMTDAINAFDEIINNMPESPNAYALAKSSLDSSLRTKRVIKGAVAFDYLHETDLGNDHPAERDMFEALPDLTLDDIAAYQKSHIAGRPFIYCIAGRIEDLDLDALRALGRVEILTIEDIFGE